MRVVVTGSDGFIGRRVVELLRDCGHDPVGYDLPDGCVMDRDRLARLASSGVDACIHLAADKYATNGELEPARVADLNIRGTENVVAAFPRVVLASTCKAAAPITCYGASKLIAERIVLNSSGSVVRLVNVLGSAGSVTDIWSQVPKGDPLPVTDCQRMFISPDEAARLLVDALDRRPGRYAPLDPRFVPMSTIAEELYPGRATVRVPLRNGDRPVERLTSDYETVVPFGDDVARIVDAWESAPSETGAASGSIVCLAN